jgi:hypothetical protein
MRIAAEYPSELVPGLVVHSRQIRPKPVGSSPMGNPGTSERRASPGWRTRFLQMIWPHQEGVPRPSDLPAEAWESRRSQRSPRTRHLFGRLFVRVAGCLAPPPQTGPPEAREMAMLRRMRADRFRFEARLSLTPTTGALGAVAPESRRAATTGMEVRSRRVQLQIGVQTRCADFQGVSEKLGGKKLARIALAARNCHAA